MAHFTVIGLGRFGVAVSQELIHLGHTVTGVDSDPKVVDKYVESLTQAAICDVGDESALQELDVANSDAVLVAIGEDMEASLLCTLALKNLNVNNIWVKASSKAHHTFVAKLGVQRIIHPEEEIGVRTAQILNDPMLDDYIALGDDQYVAEMHITKKWHLNTLHQVFGEIKNEIKVLLIKRGKGLITDIGPDFSLQTSDVILFCGSSQDLKSLSNRLV